MESVFFQQILEKGTIFYDSNVQGSPNNIRAALQPVWGD